MTFLQPWLLFALPLLAVPIIIHLVHMRRYQTVPWAAMRFLLAATKMASGYSKLRQWLVLAMRALALAALVFFTARPLASGITGWLAGDTDQLMILVVDRSPSMQQTISESGQTKLQIGIQRFAEWTSAASSQKVVVFGTGQEKPIEFTSSEAIVGDPNVSQNHLTSNIPAMLDRVREYIEQNSAARATVWICSDLRESDWRSNDGAWNAVRESFLRLNSDVRFQILDLSTLDGNRSIELMEAKQVRGENGDELSLSFRVVQFAGPRSETVEQIPVEVQVGDARSVVQIELANGNGELKGFRVPIANAKGSAAIVVADEETKSKAGWGSLRIPADSNLADNVAYFAYEPPSPRRTLVVSDNAARVDAMALCASIPSDPSMECSIETISLNQIDTVDWSQVSLVLWHDQLPDLTALPELKKFVNAGGQLLFLPPENPNDNEAFGMRWKGWKATDEGASNDGAGNTVAVATDSTSPLARVEQWRNDSQLLGNTLSGSSLPLGELGVARICQMESEGTDLASIRGGIPLLIRSDSLEENATGSVHALCTTSDLGDSTFAKDGIALYIMVQRLLGEGSARVGNAKNRFVAEESLPLLRDATPLMGDSLPLSNRYGEQAGVFASGEQTIAQNRPSSEDDARLVPNEGLVTSFGNLRWYRVEATSADSSLVQEIWRWFVIVMLAALLLESLLCIPKAKALPKVA